MSSYKKINNDSKIKTEPFPGIKTRPLPWLKFTPTGTVNSNINLHKFRNRVFSINVVSFDPLLSGQISKSELSN
jgi:hypothetical protein